MNDTVVYTGTPCTGMVRTCTSRTSSSVSEDNTQDEVDNESSPTTTVTRIPMCPYFPASTDFAVCYVQSSYSIS